MMETDHSHNGKTELDSLFWKDEILQVMYWLQGEELAESVTAERLLTFLNTDLGNLRTHLNRGVKEGYLVTKSDIKNGKPTFALSDPGKKEAGGRFVEAFEGMRKQGHGECGPECICQWEGKEACDHHNHHHH